MRSDQTIFPRIVPDTLHDIRKLRDTYLPARQSHSGGWGRHYSIMILVVLSGEPAVPCNLQSATAGLMLQSGFFEVVD